MSRNPSISKNRPGRELLPVLVVLLLTVLVPTVCVLWFMDQAVRNERLAVRQRLVDLYNDHLVKVQGLVDKYWREKGDELAGKAKTGQPVFRFQALVSWGVASSLIVYDDSGNVLFPVPMRPAPPEDLPDDWQLAEELEYEESDPHEAAKVWAHLADNSTSMNLAAQALQGQIRCLVKAGAKQEAINVIETTYTKFHKLGTDPAGQLIAPNILLYGWELTGPSDPRSDTIQKILTGMINGFDFGRMPVSQWIFLVEHLRADHFAVSADIIEELPSEKLAEEFLARNRARLAPGRLRPAGDGVWELTSTDLKIVGLFTQDYIASHLKWILKIHPEMPTIPGIAIELSPAATPATKAPFLTASAGAVLFDWQLRLFLDNDDPFAAAAQKQTTAYLWTAVLVIAAIAGLAGLMVRYLVRQVRLTRLKNDFVATVSHELKTPLASMRVLVDTLLEGHYRSPDQACEYLQLIGKENERLSRLIDNFLTFSRMERNKQAFEFAPIAPETVVRMACEAVTEKFKIDRCDLEVELAPNLPAIIADRDALVTVLLNLLDNARKYSENEKHVRVCVFAQGGHVCFEVRDRGIGLSRREQRKIFDRFYQVDQTLSRKAGGCGLGLSIVKFIVDAHEGTIDVTSQPGQGSTFAVKVPYEKAVVNQRK